MKIFNRALFLAFALSTVSGIALAGGEKEAAQSGGKSEGAAGAKTVHLSVKWTKTPTE